MYEMETIRNERLLKTDCKIFNNQPKRYVITNKTFTETKIWLMKICLTIGFSVSTNACFLKALFRAID